MRKSVRNLAVAINQNSSKAAISTASQPFYAKWLGTESVDINLSRIRAVGADEDMRYVPKGRHVAGFTAGCTVLCIPAAPAVIVLILEGDVTLAIA